MKIRIQGDSVRYRLNRKEVAQFAESGRYESAISFANGTLRYAIETDPSIDKMEAVYEPGLILVRVPAESARNWAAGDQVALTGSEERGSGGRLEILIEKDFQCLHKGEEGKHPDAYPNPAAATV